MKKETIIAIVLGVVLGLGVAVGITLKTQKTQTQKIKPVTDSLPVTPTTIVEQERSDLLEISEPQTGVIIEEKLITITGIAQKDGLMIVQSPLTSETFKTEESEFSIDFPLAAGENVILISFYPKDQSGTPIEKELKIYSLNSQ